MSLIDFIIPIIWTGLLIVAVYLFARIIMKAWLAEIDLYINKMLKKYLSKIEKEHEEEN